MASIMEACLVRSCCLLLELRIGFIVGSGCGKLSLIFAESIIEFGYQFVWLNSDDRLCKEKGVSSSTSYSSHY